MPTGHNADVLNGLSADRKKVLGGVDFTVENSTAAPVKIEEPPAAEPTEEASTSAHKAPVAAPKTTAAKKSAEGPKA